LSQGRSASGAAHAVIRKDEEWGFLAIYAAFLAA
jgi:hypothetical protein